MSDGPGLRERKKIAAMRRIQSVALDLFERDGFDAVTIETIAEASEVSPSSVYRYFGTKERIVIWDEYDPLAIERIGEELARGTAMEAVHRVMDVVVLHAFEADKERIERRMRIAFTNPSVEAASTLQAYEMADLIAGVLAEKLDREPDSLDVQVFSHAFAGGILGGLRHWYSSGFTTPLRDVVDRVLDVLEGGLDLE